MKNIKWAIDHPPVPPKETVVSKVGKFLKDRANKTFTVKDISLNLKLKPKSVSSALSRLQLGRNKTGIINGRKRILKKKSGKNRKTSYKGFKIGTVRNSKKGKWEYFQKTKFKAWKVEFKLLDTNTKNRKNEWITKEVAKKSGGTPNDAMDLHAEAYGIAPSHATEDIMIEVAAHRLLEKSLDVIKNTWGLIMYESITPDQNVFLSATLENENPLDTKYNSRWEGEVHFKGSTGFDKSAKVVFDIDENRY